MRLSPTPLEGLAVPELPWEALYLHFESVHGISHAIVAATVRRQNTAESNDENLSSARPCDVISGDVTSGVRGSNMACSCRSCPEPERTSRRRTPTRMKNRGQLINRIFKAVPSFPTAPCVIPYPWLGRSVEGVFLRVLMNVSRR